MCQLHAHNLSHHAFLKWKLKFSWRCDERKESPYTLPYVVSVRNWCRLEHSVTVSNDHTSKDTKKRSLSQFSSYLSLSSILDAPSNCKL